MSRNVKALDTVENKKSQAICAGIFGIMFTTSENSGLCRRSVIGGKLDMSENFKRLMTMWNLP